MKRNYAEGMRHLLLLIFFSLWFSQTDAFVADQLYCLKNLQQNFFREEVVNQSLSIYLVPQGLWDPINSDLKKFSRDVPNIMKTMARGRIPNPLEFPLNNFEVAKILKEALFQVFTKVMRHYYITEHPTLDYIFDYIFYRELPRLVSCFGEEVRELVPEFD